MSVVPVTFIDTESDGLRPDRRTWEVSVIRRVTGTTDIETTIIITDSGVTGREEPIALEVNRYDERFSRELQRGECRMPGLQAARTIKELTDGTVFVAAQPQFDAHSLTRLLQWHGLEPGWNRRLRDIESMTVGKLGYDPGGLVACALALGVDVDEAVTHTSLGDARLVRACWDAIHADYLGSTPQLGIGIGGTL